MYHIWATDQVRSCRHRALEIISTTCLRRDRFNLRCHQKRTCQAASDSEISGVEPQDRSGEDTRWVRSGGGIVEERWWVSDLMMDLAATAVGRDRGGTYLLCMQT